MNSICLSLIVGVTSLLAEVRQDDEDKYEIPQGVTAEVGQTYNWRASVDEITYMGVFVAGQAAFEESNKASIAMSGISEVSEVVDGNPTGLKVKLREVSQINEDGESDLDLENKTVHLTRNDQGETDYLFSDGETLSSSALEAIEQLIDVDAIPDGVDPKEWFSPGGPVAIGESWEPDVETMVMVLTNEGLVIDPDADNSCKITLESIKKTATNEYAELSLRCELSVLDMGGIELESPLPLIVTGTMIGSLDPEFPERTSQITTKIKGESAAKIEGMEVTLKVDIHVEMKESSSLTGE